MSIVQLLRNLILVLPPLFFQFLISVVPVFFLWNKLTVYYSLLVAFISLYHPRETIDQKVKILLSDFQVSKAMLST